MATQSVVSVQFDWFGYFRGAFSTVVGRSALGELIEEFDRVVSMGFLSDVEEFLINSQHIQDAIERVTPPESLRW